MKRHALFVGVDKYADPTIQNLAFPTKDAIDLAGAFEWSLKFDRVEKLANPEHADDILDVVGDMTEGLEAGDLFFFFFAGHGFRVKDNHVLVCSLDRSRDLEDEDAGLRVGRLKKRLRGPWNRMIVLDACQNDIRATRGADTGVTARDLSLIHDANPERSVGDGAQVIVTSCSEGQKALEVEKLKHGLFTSALLESVKAFADGHRLLDPDLLKADLSGRMQRLANDYCHGEMQEPMFTIPGNNRIVLLEGISSVAAQPTSAPALVVCPVCGKKNRPEETFKCSECGRDNLCLGHQNEETFLCRDCACKARAAAPKKTDGQYNESVDGLTWNFKVENGKAIIGYRNGNTPIPATAVKPEGHVDIPPALGGCPVTHIGDCAFWGCSDITRLTIPDSVEGIEFHAFYHCSEDIFDSASIPGIKLLDGWVVGVASGNPRSLDLKLVRGICGGAFKGCRNLTSVDLPSCTKSIGEAAFAYCNLTSVTLPSCVTSIGREAFNGCKSLTSVTIPNGVTNIGSYAFCGCGLTSATIPNSVTSIGDGAFFGCDHLTSVAIPNSVTSIGDGAFCGCDHLTSVAIPNSVTSIGKRAFESCGIVSVTIPKNVTSIEDGVFYDCSDLVSVVLPVSLTRVEERAFTNCHRLQSVKIPNSVKSIERGAFFRCSALDAKTKAMLKSRWPDCIE